MALAEDDLERQPPGRGGLGCDRDLASRQDQDLLQPAEATVRCGPPTATVTLDPLGAYHGLAVAPSRTPLDQQRAERGVASNKTATPVTNGMSYQISNCSVSNRTTHCRWPQPGGQASGP